MAKNDSIREELFRELIDLLYNLHSSATVLKGAADSGRLDDDAVFNHADELESLTTEVFDLVARLEPNPGDYRDVTDPLRQYSARLALLKAAADADALDDDDVFRSAAAMERLAGRAGDAAVRLSGLRGNSQAA